MQLETWSFPRSRQQVVHVVRAHAVALRVVGDELHAGHRIGLGHTTHDLTLNDHRVDPNTAVINRDHPQNIPHASLGIDFHRHDVRRERPRHIRRVVVGVVLQTRLHAVGHVAVGGHRALLNGHAIVRSTTDVEAAELPLDVLFGHLEEMCCQLPRLGTNLARHPRRRRTRGWYRAPGAWSWSRARSRVPGPATVLPPSRAGSRHSRWHSGPRRDISRIAPNPAGNHKVYGTGTGRPSPG